MTTPENTPRQAGTVLPKVTLAMLMCGMFGAAGIGAAAAASPDADVPSIKVAFDPATLATESGARHLYARLANAAAEVCPDYMNPHFVSHQVQECRTHSLQQAVMKINNPRLVAVYQSNSHSG
jgi:UrcA family protein